MKSINPEPFHTIMTSHEYNCTIPREYAEAVKAAAPDLTVCLAERGTYGYFSDGKRVVSFSADLCGLTLSGNYQPGNHNGGTGWRIADNAPVPTAENVRQLLYTPAPAWANKAPVYTTEAQYLAAYQSSSRFTKLSHETQKEETPVFP